MIVRSHASAQMWMGPVLKNETPERSYQIVSNSSGLQKPSGLVRDWLSNATRWNINGIKNTTDILRAEDSGKGDWLL